VAHRVEIGDVPGDEVDVHDRARRLTAAVENEVDVIEINESAHVAPDDRVRVEEQKRLER